MAKTQNVGESVEWGDLTEVVVHAEVRLDPPHLPMLSSKGGHDNSLTQPRERVC